MKNIELCLDPQELNFVQKEVSIKAHMFRWHNSILFLKKVRRLLMKSIVRSISIIFMMLICASVLFAGGAQEEKEAETVKIVIWAWDQRATKTTYAETLEFEKLNPNIDVEVLDFGCADAHDKVLTALVSGVGAPDVFMMEGWAMGRYSAMGALADITDLVKDCEDNYPPVFWEPYTHKGKIYGFPWDGGPSTIFYRKDILDNEGVEFPANWQEFIETGRKLATSNRYIFSVHGEVASQWLWGRGGVASDYDGKILFDNPKVVETYQWVGDRIAKDKMFYYKKPWEPGTYELIKADKMVGVVAGFWYSGFGISNFAYKPELEGKWRVSRWLPWKDGDSPTGSVLGGAGFAIPVQSKHAEEAAEWMKYVLGRKESQYNQALEHGIFPTQIGAIEELGKKSIKIYGGQKVFKELLEGLMDTPPITFGPNYSVISIAMDKALDEIVLKGTPAAKAIKDAAAQAELEKVY